MGQPATSELLPGRKSCVIIETIRIPDAGPQCNAWHLLETVNVSNSLLWIFASNPHISNALTKQLVLQKDRKQLKRTSLIMF